MDTKYTYDYPMPSHVVDAVVFGFSSTDGSLKVLLIKRGDEPFKDCWALPGGYVHIDEEAIDAVSRELKEETTVELKLRPLATFSTVGRDPRGRVISEAFMTIVNHENIKAEGKDDAKEAAWFLVEQLPPLAFDHEKIIQVAVDKLSDLAHSKP